MKDWQKRVVVEQEELGKKLLSLKNYINLEEFKSLSSREQFLLIEQRRAMNMYNEVLKQRISEF